MAQAHRNETGKQGRRRGTELKEAIFKATVEILEKQGYEAVSFQNVARKAHVTRSVIYRYWKDTFDLIYQASRYHLEVNPEWKGSVTQQIFNTGNLRQDLIDLCQYMQFNASLFPKNFLPFIFFEESQGRHLMDDMTSEISINNIIIIERILARAQERGEAKEDIGRSAKLLPFQILRYHFMIDGKDMITEDIEKLVDQIFLPIYEKK